MAAAAAAAIKAAVLQVAVLLDRPCVCVKLTVAAAPGSCRVLLFTLRLLGQQPQQTAQGAASHLAKPSFSNHPELKRGEPV